MSKDSGLRHETCGSDDLAWRTLLDRWNGGGFIWDCKLVEGEEDSMEEGWSLEWTSITKAGLTAENRPAYEAKSDGRQERAMGDARISM